VPTLQDCARRGGLAGAGLGGDRAMAGIHDPVLLQFKLVSETILRCKKIPGTERKTKPTQGFRTPYQRGRHATVTRLARAARRRLQVELTPALTQVCHGKNTLLNQLVICKFRHYKKP